MGYIVLSDKELERYHKLQELKKKLEKYNPFHTKEKQLTSSNDGYSGGTKYCDSREQRGSTAACERRAKGKDRDPGEPDSTVEGQQTDTVQR
jgi:hypothetical protein